jgi:uncharacterized protein involved in exopolysaccharide biosynthesis
MLPNAPHPNWVILPADAMVAGPSVSYHRSLRDLVRIFLRRKELFILACAVVCLIGGAYLLFTPPLYLSTASLVLHFDNKLTPDIDRTRMPNQMQGSNEHREILYSDADMLKSPDLAHKVIEAVGLARLYPKIAAKQETDARKQDDALKAYNSNLVVDVGLQSDVLNLSFLSANPAISRDVLQHLLDGFFAQEAEVYANPQLKFAEDEANAAKAKLAAAQQALSDFKSQHEIADLQQQVKELLRQQTDVGSRMNIAQGRVLEAEQRQGALKELLDSVSQTVTSSAGGTYQAVDQAEAQLDTLRAKRSQMLNTYRADGPIVQQLNAQIASLERAANARDVEARNRSAVQPNPVYQSIKTDYIRAAAEATSAREPQQVLTGQLKQINDRIADLEAQQSRYDDLTRAVQIQNDTYRTLAIRYETARDEANRNAQKISAAVVITAPTLAITPARPRRKLVAAATLLVALLAGTASVLLIEAIDDRIRTPRDVAHFLQLPVLATFEGDD